MLLLLKFPDILDGMFEMLEGLPRALLLWIAIPLHQVEGLAISHLLGFDLLYFEVIILLPARTLHNFQETLI